MKKFLPFIFWLTVILAACRGAENKADDSDTQVQTKDTVNAESKDTNGAKQAPKISEENIKDNALEKSGQARGIAPSIEPSDILSKIDTHLISSAQYTVTPAGGIINCTVTVTNTLSDVTFQKAMLEVTFQKADGSVIKIDYYTVLNIEPGMSKVIKIPDTTTGAKVVTQIVKVKSTELTKGEWVLCGSHFVAK